jgi:hypothetical protein
VNIALARPGGMKELYALALSLSPVIGLLSVTIL